ncbi:MAG: DNA recombination protein RmuC [Nitrospinota bacterium]
MENFAAGLIVGIIFSLAAAYFLRRIFFRESETNRKEIMDAMKASFGSLSLDALSKSTEEFLKLAGEKFGSEREMSAKELDSKKRLIDQQLQGMTVEMEKVSKIMKELEKDRVEKFGELSTQLKSTNEQTTALIKTTNTLNEALASTKVRGQWGERMAEDVLRLAGFIENVNYVKQKSIEGIGTIPDFTFLLPRSLKVNMDVKFPYDNYIKFLEAGLNSEKERFLKDFLRDIKNKIKEVTTRDYINPEQNTLDYVLLFIPNEQIYAFIHEHDRSIMDEGIKNRVVFCSPITLFAVLAVIRQAVDNFALEQTSNEILSLFGAFKKQWHEFINRLEAVGKRIGDAQKEYDAVMTTRRRQLEKPLGKIEELRSQRELPIAPIDGEKLPPDKDREG